MEDTKAVNESVDSTVCTAAGKGESVQPGFIILLHVIALSLR